MSEITDATVRPSTQFEQQASDVSASDHTDQIQPVAIGPQTAETLEPHRGHSAHIVRRAGFLALGSFGGLMLANSVFPAQGNIGPVDVAVRLRPSNSIVIDNQILPGLSHESPLGVIGADVRINRLGINTPSVIAGVAGARAGENQTKSSSDYMRYLESFNNVSGDIRGLEHDVVRHNEWWALGGMLAAGGLMLSAAGYRKYLQTHKPQVAGHWQSLGNYYSRRRYVLPATTLAIAAPLSIAATSADYQLVRPTAAFANTPLKGWQLTGELAPQVEQGASYAQNFIGSNNSYYRQISAQLDEALTPSFVASMPHGNNVVAVEFRSDQHMHPGTEPAEIETAKRMKVDVIADVGDADVSGTNPIETLATKDITDDAKKLGIPLVMAEGNHDSSQSTDPHQSFNTKATEEKQGALVVDEPDNDKDKSRPVISVKTKHGQITFASIRDPRRSRFGDQIDPSDPAAQTALLTAQGHKIGKYICDYGKPVDIIMAHDSLARDTALESNCDLSPFAISGHVHHRVDTAFAGFTTNDQAIYNYTEGTSGGAGDNFTYGPLKARADWSVAYFDVAKHVLLGQVFFSVQPTPDAVTLISPFTPPPTPSDEEKALYADDNRSRTVALGQEAGQK